MKLIYLHDIDNPSQRIPMDAEDFSAAVPYGMQRLDSFVDTIAGKRITYAQLGIARRSSG